MTLRSLGRFRFTHSGTRTELDVSVELPDLPAYRHACRNLGASLRSIPVGFPAILDVSQGVASGILLAALLMWKHPMPTLTDATLIIRCPHCMAGIDFRSMIAYKDGRFVCRDCAHTVRPGVPEYKCTCRPCLRLSRNPLLTDHRSNLLTQ
jgi:hypothetical protein